MDIISKPGLIKGVRGFTPGRIPYTIKLQAEGYILRSVSFFAFVFTYEY